MALVVVGDQNVYAFGVPLNAQTIPPPPPYPNQEASVQMLGNTVPPLPDGTYEVVSVSVYAQILALGGPVTMEFALYTDLLACPNTQIANSYAAQVFPINSAASWKTMVYPNPRPTIVVAGGAPLGHICINATGGRVGSSVTYYWDNGVTPATVFDIGKNDPAANGLFSNPWGLPGGPMVGSVSAYIVIDVPPMPGGHPPEKLRRLRHMRGRVSH